MASVLVVDDSKFMRKMLSDILTQEGHQIVAEAENAREAIELYKKFRPELVTLDIVMPEVEGEGSLSALISIIEINPQVNVVMVSAMGQEETIKECTQAGAKDFILKPFKPPDVARVVSAVMRSV